jgi:hypothetical protein
MLLTAIRGALLIQEQEQLRVAFFGFLSLCY